MSGINFLLIYWKQRIWPPHLPIQPVMREYFASPVIYMIWESISRPSRNILEKAVGVEAFHMLHGVLPIR